MGKIVGKIVFLFATFFAIQSYAGIRLDIRNVDGISTDTIVAGQPFVVEVIVDSIQGSVSTPTVEGLDRWTERRNGIFMNTVNGVTTTKYTHQARIEQPGVYKIGPARTMYQQQELISDIIALKITDDVAAQVAVKGQKKSTTELKAFLRLSVDTDHVVVGQKIKATLRFYYQDLHMSLSQIVQPELIGFDIQSMGKPVGGTTEINGTRYRYAEWQWDMYPTQPGEFVLPAYSADYEIPVQDNRFLGGLFMFVSQRADKKRVYSNTVKIVVDALPHNTIPAQAIGCFDFISATINPPIAKEGEGMVLVIDIIGTGNIHAIKVPALTLPPELRYYDSNSTIIDSLDDGTSKKRFEFIIQGMKAGDYEIPEQSFVYFDIKKNAYVTLRTSPLSVSIQSSNQKEKIGSSVNEHAVSDGILHDYSQDLSIAPLNVMGPWHPVSEGISLSWIVFHCLWLLPLAYCGYPTVRNHTSRIMFYSQRGLKKRACSAARKKIKECAQQADGTQLYTIFVELFALLSHRPSPAITHDEIEKFIITRGFSEQEYTDWKMFFERVAHAAYAHNNRENVYELCRMAVEWVNCLEKRA